MGRKFKKTLIVLLLALCALFVFAGCELGETKDDALALRGLDPQVTYYANGGRFEKNNQKKVTNFYYKVGATAYDYIYGDQFPRYFPECVAQLPLSGNDQTVVGSNSKLFGCNLIKIPPVPL